jgi:hypothetical protein
MRILRRGIVVAERICSVLGKKKKFNELLDTHLTSSDMDICAVMKKYALCDVLFSG